MPKKHDYKNNIIKLNTFETCIILLTVTQINSIKKTVGLITLATHF